MMHFAIEHCSDSVWLNPEPKTFHDAVRNIYAFSDEGRRRQWFRDTPGAIEYTNAPRMRKYFGWTTISGEKLCALRPDARPPRNENGRHYTWNFTDRILLRYRL